MASAVAQKRAASGGTVSRRRATHADTEMDMAVVNDQLCNRRYHIKEASPNTKVCLSSYRQCRSVHCNRSACFYMVFVANYIQ